MNRYAQHADFDGAGLAITNWLSERAGTIPWRMTAEDDVTAAAGRDGSGFTAIPETPWDPPLRTVMHGVGRAVYEEELRADLLASMI